MSLLGTVSPHKDKFPKMVCGYNRLQGSHAIDYGNTTHTCMHTPKA